MSTTTGAGSGGSGVDASKAGLTNKTSSGERESVTKRVEQQTKNELEAGAAIAGNIALAFKDSNKKLAAQASAAQKAANSAATAIASGNGVGQAASAIAKLRNLGAAVHFLSAMQVTANPVPHAKALGIAGLGVGGTLVAIADLLENSRVAPKGNAGVRGGLGGVRSRSEVAGRGQETYTGTGKEGDDGVSATFANGPNWENAVRFPDSGDSAREESLAQQAHRSLTEPKQIQSRAAILQSQSEKIQAASGFGGRTSLDMAFVGEKYRNTYAGNPSSSAGAALNRVFGHISGDFAAFPELLSRIEKGTAAAAQTFARHSGNVGSHDNHAAYAVGQTLVNALSQTTNVGEKAAIIAAAMSLAAVADVHPGQNSGSDAAIRSTEILGELNGKFRDTTGRAEAAVPALGSVPQMTGAQLAAVENFVNAGRAAIQSSKDGVVALQGFYQQQVIDSVVRARDLALNVGIDSDTLMNLFMNSLASQGIFITAADMNRYMGSSPAGSSEIPSAGQNEDAGSSGAQTPSGVTFANMQGPLSRRQQ